LYLTWWARQNGGEPTVIETADSINRAVPKYVAQRALNMIEREIENPRVLLLGVAYKPGVGDIRDTPVSELRDYLMAQGAEVAWHDPLVPVWEGSNPVDLNWHCDVAILATNQPGMDLNQLIAKGIQILDCTNSISGQAGVSSL
jgi:UDP-N-acetyl-D-glucosamine dehydrogenase